MKYILMNNAEWRLTWAWWLISTQVEQCIIDWANAAKEVLDENPRTVLDKVLDWIYPLWKFSEDDKSNRSVNFSTKVYVHKFRLNNWKILEIQFLPNSNTEIIVCYDWKEEKIFINDEERKILAEKINKIQTPPVYHAEWRWAWVQMI